MDYEAPDKKSFKKSSEKGSGIVRHLVFDRLLRSEGETSSGREHHNSAITPANYTFILAGEDEIGSYDGRESEELMAFAASAGRDLGGGEDGRSTGFSVDREQYVINPPTPLQSGTGETNDPDAPPR